MTSARTTSGPCIPFDGIDNPRSYLSKILRYGKVYNNFNSLSLSHRADYVTACLDSWLQRIPFGTYNITNPGYISTPQVLEMIQSILKPDREFTFWESDADFYATGALAPRSNCIMDISKLNAAGIQIRTVDEALQSSLENWTAAK